MIISVARTGPAVDHDKYYMTIMIHGKTNTEYYFLEASLQSVGSNNITKVLK